jgi:hypothetical protein
MTRTEQRLEDALHAKAGTVRTDQLRPLAEPRRRSVRGRTWLAPVAAAAAVALVIGLAVTIAGHVHPPRPAPSVAPATPTAPPRYYAQIVGMFPHGQIVVRSTVTGAVIGRPANPAAAVLSPAQYAEPVEVATAPDDRTFYVQYFLGTRTMIYSFGITDRGTVTAMTLVKGGVLNAESYGIDVGNLAVSPDGTNLALTVDTAYSTKTPGVADEIVVLDLRTGTRRVWQDGLYKAGRQFSIQSLSWSGTGTLDFLSAWCTPYASACSESDGIDWDAQIRSLNVVSEGGSLAGSTVLLRESTIYPDIASMVADQQGNLSVVVMSGPDAWEGQPTTVTVDEVQASSGNLERVLYYHGFHAQAAKSLYFYTIGADPSGRYLTLSISLGTYNLAGWLDQGVIRPVPGSLMYGITW